jgi:diguanylate cyclase
MKPLPFREHLPWLVRKHHQLRSLSFVAVFGTVVLHFGGQPVGTAMWAYLIAQLLLYPHLMLVLACRAPDPVARELLHLRVDAFALGLCAALLGLPTLFSFAVAIGALFNSAVNQGWRGSGQAGLAFVAGALTWWATGRFTWQPDSNWPSTLFCLATLTLYLLTMGNVARIRIGQLRQARLALEESTQALGSANEALKLRLDDINRLQEQLREQAHRDPLTGQYNRRYLDTTLQREMLRAAREQLPITLLMVDIDHFKAINDTHGHPVGDEVLRQIGLILATHARSHDVVCRYGGEEFLVLLPQLPSALALQRAEQLRRSAKTHVFSTEAGDIRVTLSVGVATYPDHGQTVDELLRSADHALYQAKREGRNRVVQAQILA